MVGVLVSSKTLSGRRNRWPGRYPLIEEVGNIFVASPRALNFIHYNTDEPDTLADQLDELVARGGPCLHGFQINLPWPDPEQLRLFQDRCKNRTRSYQLVVQIGEDAISQMDRDIGAIADRIHDEYADLAKYVLYDPSGGYGKQLDYPIAMQYIRIIARRPMDVQLVVAGGLSASNLSIVRYLAEDLSAEVPGFELSIDAESQLRSGDSGDSLDLEKVEAYLSAALEILEPQALGATKDGSGNGRR